MYAAGWNMPGYMPETDPEVFETFAEGRDYLLDTVERFADSDADVMDAIELATKWDDLIDQIKALPDEMYEWQGYDGDLTLSFWVQLTEEDASDGE